MPLSDAVKTPSERALEAGIAPSTVLRRIANGLTLEEAIARGSPRRRVGVQINNFEVVRELYQKVKGVRGRALLATVVMRCLTCGTEKKVPPGEKPGCARCSNAKRRRTFDVHGQQLSFEEVSELYGSKVKRTTFLNRVAKGMSAVEAITCSGRLRTKPG